jgi:predicted alpha-1,6-mannanase (GH76 family)
MASFQARAGPSPHLSRGVKSSMMTAASAVHSGMTFIHPRDVRCRSSGAAGGGDGGLFARITARYLDLAATTLLPGDTAADVAARETARGLAGASARAAGGARARSADGAVHASEAAERDLSVQISGRMLLEAACAVSAGGRSC